MNKDYLLRSLAENGYNVLFGAKKHFATFDIVEKIPGVFATFSLLIGVWQIYRPSFTYNSEISLILIFLSIIALTISLYNSEKERYREIGTQLTVIHNKLRTLYYRVKLSQEETFQSEEVEMERLLEEYYRINISKQILLSAIDRKTFSQKSTSCSTLIPPPFFDFSVTLSLGSCSLSIPLLSALILLVPF